MCEEIKQSKQAALLTQHFTLWEDNTMKQTTKMSRAVGQLEKIYRCLNEDFFDDSLPVPIITVQSKPGTCVIAPPPRSGSDRTETPTS